MISQKNKAQSVDKYLKDHQKILKLYSYKNWEEFMMWVEEKLEESGETVSNG
jgi:preprotein translocase subunit Sss1